MPRDVGEVHHRHDTGLVVDPVDHPVGAATRGCASLPMHLPRLAR
jgi:hypothetical protein